MSLDAAKGTVSPAPGPNGMSKPEAETFTGLDTEHIYIGDQFADQSAEPTTVRKCERILNRVRGTITELTFYDEGFLKIREGAEKKLIKEHTLELRFMKPEPVTTRRIANVYLWSSLGIGLLGLFLSIILPLMDLAQYTISFATILATLAVLSLLFFVYRSEVTHQFCTASGKTVVLSLTGSLGCNRSMRAMACEIRDAILLASAETGVHDIHYLRAEMQAHYDLAETGVITRKACSDGTTLILSKFE